MSGGEEVRYCAGETHPASLESPPDYCEEEAMEGSDFCYWHDPDGAAYDAAEARAEAAREEAAFGGYYG